MKPSEKILAQAAKKGLTKNGVITAILDYLDEEWEKKQEGPYEHRDD